MQQINRFDSQESLDDKKDSALFETAFIEQQKLQRGQTVVMSEKEKEVTVKKRPEPFYPYKVPTFGKVYDAAILNHFDNNKVSPKNIFIYCRILLFRVFND